MPIAPSDLKFRLSVKTGSAGNSQAGTPAGSLGKYMSTTDITDNVLENLFDNISAAESTAGDTEYRCFFVFNTHASITLQSAKFYISAEVANGASVQIGVDPAGVVDYNQAAPQAAEIATEQDAPVGVSWSAPTTYDTGVSLGDIAPNKCIGLWVKRTIAPATPPLANDGATFSVQGTTVA